MILLNQYSDSKNLLNQSQNHIEERYLPSLNCACASGQIVKVWGKYGLIHPINQATPLLTLLLSNSGKPSITNLWGKPSLFTDTDKPSNSNLWGYSPLVYAYSGHQITTYGDESLTMTGSQLLTYGGISLVVAENQLHNNGDYILCLSGGGGEGVTNTYGVVAL